jgi:Transglutaminase-like superfamily
MQAWTRFRRLRRPERRIVVAAVAALPATWLALRLAGFRRSTAMLMRLAPLPNGTPLSDDAEVSPEEIARLTHATARSLPFASNCLDRSLALCWLLRRRGIAAHLRIGARKDGEQLKAHAWVESHGVPLDDAEAQHRHFIPFEGALALLETESL